MNNLIRVERSIAKYNINDEHIVSEENIDSISLKFLLSIVTPSDDDPLLYEGYILSEKQLMELNNHCNNKLVFDLDSYYYVLECDGIYDYTKG